MGVHRRNEEGTRGDISVHLGFPISNAEPERGARLEIIDEMSGLMMISVNLTAIQLLEMMAGQHTRAHAEVFVPHPGRLGKRMETVNTLISGGGISGEEADTAAEATAAGYRDQGWEFVGITRTNTGGRNVTARRWVAPETEGHRYMPGVGSGIGCDARLPGGIVRCGAGKDQHPE